MKRFFRAEARGCVCPPDFPVCACGKDPVLRVLTTRAVRPGRTRGGAQPALGIGAAARRGEGLMAATAPVARTGRPVHGRPRRRRRHRSAPRSGGSQAGSSGSSSSPRCSPAWWRSTSRCCASTSHYDELGQKRVEAARRERRARLAARQRRVDRPYSEARGRGARRDARLARPDHIRRLASVMRARRPSDRRIRLLLLLLLAGLRDFARARDVAADGACGRPQPARVEPAARDRDHPGRSRGRSSIAWAFSSRSPRRRSPCTRTRGR